MPLRDSVDFESTSAFNYPMKCQERLEQKNRCSGSSLVVQWLVFHDSPAGAWVRSLIQEQGSHKTHTKTGKTKTKTVHLQHLNCLGYKSPVGKDLIQPQLEPGHVQTCLINYSGGKASKEAGLDREITNQLKEKQLWSPPSELGFFLCALNSISGDMVCNITLFQGYNVDPEPQTCSLFIDIPPTPCQEADWTD